MREALTIDTLLLKKAALQYRAINHPLRQKILQLLHKNGRLAVTPIYATMKLEQSVASQHLAILRRAGLVITEREGKHIFYSVNYQRLKLLYQLAFTLCKHPTLQEQ
jgi:DNA-binding transcriptional ArsR family regulator